MKNILMVLLMALTFSCNNAEKTTDPILACPLFLEFEKLDVSFEFLGALPVIPKLHLNREIVPNCDVGQEKDFCIESYEAKPGMLKYLVRSLREVYPAIEIEMFDGTNLRLARNGETLTRTRTRPNDPCGSGYVSRLTIKE